MYRSVLDASALLAYIHGEPGAHRVTDALSRRCLINVVNWAEVLSKIARDNFDVKTFVKKFQTKGVLDVSLSVVPLIQRDAQLIAELHRKYPHISIADRACLAVADRLNLPVLTADREWKKLDIQIDIILIR